jgi:hypothetical protein
MLFFYGMALLCLFYSKWNIFLFQDTWMNVTKNMTGKKVIEKYISETVAYYIK